MTLSTRKKRKEKQAVCCPDRENTPGGILKMQFLLKEWLTGVRTGRWSSFAQVDVILN